MVKNELETSLEAEKQRMLKLSQKKGATEDKIDLDDFESNKRPNLVLHKPNRRQNRQTKIAKEKSKVQAKPKRQSLKPVAREIIPKSLFMITLLPAPQSYAKETPIIALDCEMVVCSDSQKHLARLSIVNYNRQTLFDEFIKPELPVVNYLNHVTNIDSFKLHKALPFSHYRSAIEALLRERTVVGHTIDYDFEAMKVVHDDKLKRDISEFSYFKKDKFKTSLKELTDRFLNMKIQEGKHSSVEDARAALELYKLYKEEIDAEFKDAYFAKLKSDGLLVLPEMD
jgi:RNA exonuclease 4